jgi:hypothetical protein
MKMYFSYLKEEKAAPSEPWLQLKSIEASTGGNRDREPVEAEKAPKL